MFLPKHSQLSLVLLISGLLMAACGPAGGEATATPLSVDAIYTAAAETLQAQMAATAAAQPLATQTPAPTGTGTATPTAGIPPTSAVIQPPASNPSGCNQSAYVTDVTIPDGQQIAPGQVFTKTWRLQNTGTCAWNTNYKMTFISGDVLGGVATALTQSVGTGGSLDVSVVLTAPATPQKYTGYWRLASETGQTFGVQVSVQINVAGTPVTPGTTTITVQPSITPTYGAVGCNNSALISDVTIPDGTQIKAGESFRKTWRIKNNGTCAWVSAYKFFFTGGELMGSDTTMIRRTVAINATTDFSLDFVAPNTPGTYIGYWRMMSDTGTLFGAGFSVRIVVPGATYTPIPPSNTPSITPTPVPASATLTPTVTETVTPTP